MSTWTHTRTDNHTGDGGPYTSEHYEGEIEITSDFIPEDGTIGVSASYEAIEGDDSTTLGKKLSDSTTIHFYGAKAGIYGDPTLPRCELTTHPTTERYTDSVRLSGSALTAATMGGVPAATYERPVCDKYTFVLEYWEWGYIARSQSAPPTLTASDVSYEVDTEVPADMTREGTITPLSGLNGYLYQNYGGSYPGTVAEVSAGTTYTTAIDTGTNQWKDLGVFTQNLQATDDDGEKSAAVGREVRITGTATIEAKVGSATTGSPYATGRWVNDDVFVTVGPTSATWGGS
ncbi:MAG: hypothetical protein LBH64_02660, partial [Coriobacteriales bacterium]|nr:hypothetical protein [Coriobacteriales bacterium]